jgi:hypothetical protein
MPTPTTTPFQLSKIIIFLEFEKMGTFINWWCIYQDFTQNEHTQKNKNQKPKKTKINTPLPTSYNTGKMAQKKRDIKK